MKFDIAQDNTTEHYITEHEGQLLPSFIFVPRGKPDQNHVGKRILRGQVLQSEVSTSRTQPLQPDSWLLASSNLPLLHDLRLSGKLGPKNHKPLTRCLLPLPGCGHLSAANGQSQHDGNTHRCNEAFLQLQAF